MERCSGAFAHFGNLCRVISSKCTLIPHVAHHHSLPSNRRNQSIQQQEHGSVVVVYFNEEPLTFLLLENVFHREIDVVVFSDPGDELVDLDVVVIYGLKQRVESLNDVEI